MSIGNYVFSSFSIKISIGFCAHLFFLLSILQIMTKAVTFVPFICEWRWRTTLSRLVVISCLIIYMPKYFDNFIHQLTMSFRRHYINAMKTVYIIDTTLTQILMKWAMKYRIAEENEMVTTRLRRKQIRKPSILHIVAWTNVNLMICVNCEENFPKNRKN